MQAIGLQSLHPRTHCTWLWWPREDKGSPLDERQQTAFRSQERRKSYVLTSEPWLQGLHVPQQKITGFKHSSGSPKLDNSSLLEDTQALSGSPLAIEDLTYSLSCLPPASRWRKDTLKISALHTLDIPLAHGDCVPTEDT